MRAKILSLNIGEPKEMTWNGKTISSSMEKYSVPGPLIVHMDRIDGNSFVQPAFHGTNDSVLYAYGLSSAEKYAKILGLDSYPPGTTGETLTLDHFNEREISVGDVFQIGTVEAQAVYPRIPCGKLNFRMQRPDGLKAMQDAGVSGVYFRILKPGKISLTDEVIRVQAATHRFSIFDLYKLLLSGEAPTKEEYALARANGAFQKKLMEKWDAYWQ